MTTNSWIAAVRRKLSVVSAAASLAAISLSTSTAAADEPLVTRIGRFQIPFDVEAEPGQPVEGFAVLFGSQDGGQTWEQLQSVPAAQGKFTFNAPVTDVTLSPFASLTLRATCPQPTCRVRSLRWK